MNLKHLSDESLLTDIKLYVKKEKSCTIQVLHHLKEIEKRRLFADLGFSSLFDYAVRELGYSEAEASRRISSARLIKELPYIERKLIEGTFSLTNLAKAASVLAKQKTPTETKKAILSQLENKTTRECEKFLSLFETKKEAKEQIKAITPERSSFTVTLTDKTLRNLEKLKGHLAHKKFNTDELLNYVFNMALEKLLIDKYHLNTSGIKSESTTRYIPTEIRKRVYLRGKGRCQNCKSVYKVEFDHILPFAMGGKQRRKNLRLLCFSCNQRARIRSGNSCRV